MNVSIFKWLSFWCIVTADQQIGGSLDGSRVDIIPVVVSVCWFGLSVVNWDCCQTLGIYILVKTVGVDKKDVGNYGMGSRYRTFKWLHWYVYYMSVIFILCWLLLWLALLYCYILFSWRLTGLRLKVTITVAACLSCYCIAENYSRWLMFVCLLATCKQFIPLFFFLTAVVLLFQGAVCIIFMQWNELPSSLSLCVTELIILCNVKWGILMALIVYILCRWHTIGNQYKRWMFATLVWDTERSQSSSWKVAHSVIRAVRFWQLNLCSHFLASLTSMSTQYYLQRVFHSGSLTFQDFVSSFIFFFWSKCSVFIFQQLFSQWYIICCYLIHSILFQKFFSLKVKSTIP